MYVTTVNVLLLDDVSSDIKVERQTHGYKLNCSVVYRGRHRPEMSWISVRRTTLPVVSRSFVNKATYHVVSSEIFISSNDKYTLPAFCQVSVPLYRCNELSSVYTLKFPIHHVPSEGEYTISKGKRILFDDHSPVVTEAFIQVGCGMC